ncbi:MAG: NACHT domain-containing protein, partial [Chloroflexota bacterium]
MSNDINLNADGDLSAGDVTGRDKIVGDQINQFNAAQNIYNITITLAPQFARESRSEDELKILWRQATNKYTDRIFNELGQIQILGQPHPKPLVEVFTDVYTHPRPTSWQRFNPDELEKQFERHGRFGRRDDLERFNALEVARLNSRLFLLGKPGSGKTTLLKYLAIQAADSKEENRVMPIFVPLRDLARSTQHKTLFEYIRDLFKSSGFPAPTRFARQLLSSGRALVMLDGLDEVSVENDLRGELSDSIQAFVREFYQSRFIISSRTAATEYMFEGFYYIEMADFSEEQTTLFIKQWFAGEHETADMFLDEINKAENRGIRELAQSPLLLTLLSLHFDVALNFPRERSEIYESALRVLFEKWDASRRISRRKRELEQHGVHYKSLTTKRKEQLMSRIASKAFEIGRIFFPQAWLEDEIVDFLSKVPPRPPKDEIEGELVLKAMESQHGLLIQRARRVYSFSHLTFQEYFTARYIVDHIGMGSIEDLVTIPKISTPRWHEV